MAVVQDRRSLWGCVPPREAIGRSAVRAGEHHHHCRHDGISLPKRQSVEISSNAQRLVVCEASGVVGNKQRRPTRRRRQQTRPREVTGRMTGAVRRKTAPDVSIPGRQTGRPAAAAPWTRTKNQLVNDRKQPVLFFWPSYLPEGSKRASEYRRAIRTEKALETGTGDAHTEWGGGRSFVSSGCIDDSFLLSSASRAVLPAPLGLYRTRCCRLFVNGACSSLRLAPATCRRTRARAGQISSGRRQSTRIGSPWACGGGNRSSGPRFRFLVMGFQGGRAEKLGGRKGWSFFSFSLAAGLLT
jgi:hypothetical protein